MESEPNEREIGRLIFTGVAVSALAVAVFALWQVRQVDDRLHDLSAQPAAPPAASPAAPPTASAPVEGSVALSLTRRMDDLERKLGLLVAKSEGRVPKSAAQHASDKKRLEGQIAGLRREMNALALAVSSPMGGADAGAADQDDEDDDDAGDADEGDDAGATSDAGVVDPGANDGPVLVERDKLLETLRDQTLRAVVREFASIVNLSADQRDEVESVVRDRRDAHTEVTRAVTLGNLSVRDASIQIDKANEVARQALSKTLTSDQVQHFQTILSRLDALSWRF